MNKHGNRVNQEKQNGRVEHATYHEAALKDLDLRFVLRQLEDDFCQG